MSKIIIPKMLMSLDKARRHLRIAESYFREIKMDTEAKELTEAFQILTELTAKIEAMEINALSLPR